MRSMDAERLDALLLAGRRRAEIAAKLGVSPSTISRHARRLGHPPLRSPRSRFDWQAIQEYHDLGHSIRVCCERFGVSRGAWDGAVSRGAIVNRPGASTRKPGSTRRAVEQMLEAGMSHAEIARELEVSKPTISYHARRLGRAPDPRFSRRIDWNAVQRMYDGGATLQECQQAFGFAKASWSPAVKRCRIVPRSRAMSLELLLAGERNRTHLKGRLLALGLKKPCCELCVIARWRDQALVLALHHVNGTNDDNRVVISGAAVVERAGADGLPQRHVIDEAQRRRRLRVRERFSAPRRRRIAR